MAKVQLLRIAIPLSPRLRSIMRILWSPRMTHIPHNYTEFEMLKTHICENAPFFLRVLVTSEITEDFDEAHNAAADVAATARCFLELIRIGVVKSDKAGLSPEAFKTFQTANPSQIKTEDIDVGNQVAASKKAATKKVKDNAPKIEITHDFAHIHCHSQFSVLQSTIQIKNLVNRAVEYGMPAVAITDHANMFGTFHFVSAVEAANNEVDDWNEKIESGEEQGSPKNHIKGIVGCEFYLR